MAASSSSLPARPASVAACSRSSYGNSSFTDSIIVRKEPLIV
jgi:hypothetical protein